MTQDEGEPAGGVAESLTAAPQLDDVAEIGAAATVAIPVDDRPEALLHQDNILRTLGTVQKLLPKLSLPSDITCQKRLVHAMQTMHDALNDTIARCNV